MDKQKIENLGKKHMKLLLIHIENAGLSSKLLRKLILDKFNDFVRELQESSGE